MVNVSGGQRLMMRGHDENGITHTINSGQYGVSKKWYIKEKKTITSFWMNILISSEVIWTRNFKKTQCRRKDDSFL